MSILKKARKSKKDSQNYNSEVSVLYNDKSSPGNKNALWGYN